MIERSLSTTSIMPGRTAFTRTPCGPHSVARTRVRPISPCFADVCAASAKLVGGLAHALRVAPVEDYACTAGRQLRRDASTDAAARPGDDRDTAVEVHDEQRYHPSALPHAPVVVHELASPSFVQ